MSARGCTKLGSVQVIKVLPWHRGVIDKSRDKQTKTHNGMRWKDVKHCESLEDDRANSTRAVLVREASECHGGVGA